MYKCIRKQPYLVASVFVQHEQHYGHDNNYTEENEGVGERLPHLGPTVRLGLVGIMEWGVDPAIEINQYQDASLKFTGD